ncbi:protein tyrosine phosphatase [Klebsiella pneumoniae]|nr:protein tyrosine phosphatase [Klebsiella pneumoniae]
MKQHLPDKEIASAGIGALVGKTADKSTISIAEKHQLSLEGHEARKLTKEMCREYSLILVIDKGHIDAVCRLAPEVRGKPCFSPIGWGRKKFPILTERAPKRMSLFTAFLMIQPKNGPRH